MMAGLFKMIRTLAVLAVVAAGVVALLNRRDKVKQIWDSLGGTDGVVNSASKLIESAGPIRDVVNQLTQLKK